VLFLSVGVVAHHRVEDTRERLEDRFLTLRREEQVVAAELERSSRARELIDGVRSRLVRAEEVSRAGLPFEHIVESAFSAFGADGALLSLTAFQPLEQEQDGTAVVISGWTDPHPLHGARRIAAIADALARAPGLTVERVEPPAELPGLDRDGRARPLSFLVRLRAAPTVDLAPLTEEAP
jgi:hypothetical protein